MVQFEQKTYGDQAIFNARFLPDGQGHRLQPRAASETCRSCNICRVRPWRRAESGPMGTTLLSVSDEGELAVLTDAEYRNHRVLKGTLARMSIEGHPRPLIENVRDADWGEDGELAIVRRVGGIDRLEYPIGNVLYETPGYIGEPRISPDGKRVAFLDHQWWLDDRGWLKVVDEFGKVATLTEEYWAIQGVVWQPDGSEILFSGAVGGSTLQPLVADLDDGLVRPFLGVPSAMTILDRDDQGRLLALSTSMFYGVAAHLRDSDEDVDLTWLDNCWGAILSPDSKKLIFVNGRGGANYSVVTRTVDGSPLTTLGEGDLKSLSPDGNWVLAQIAMPPGVAVYPTGTGTARNLPAGPLVQFHNSFWFPDNEHVLIVGNESGGAVRCYRQSILGGTPVLISITGAENFDLLTLDGSSILGQDANRDWFLFPLDGGAPSPMPGLHDGDEIWAWNPDGTGLYVTERREVPSTLIRVDLATQERHSDFVLGPATEPGLVWLMIEGPVFDPADGYAYSYLKSLSNLFIVDGARR